jgi:formylglycine-generating enzyme required for sulfatase activity
MTPTPTAVRWVSIPAGTCWYGDAARPRPVAALLVAQTPLTQRQCGMDDTDLPVTRISNDDAARLADHVGGRLPTSLEWEWIAAGPGRSPYPWGPRPWTPQLAVLTGNGHTPLRPRPVGSCPAGANPFGVLDLAGNTWEWTATPVMGGGHVIRGGSYTSTPLYARTTFLNAAPAELRSPAISVRPVKTS